MSTYTKWTGGFRPYNAVGGGDNAVMPSRPNFFPRIRSFPTHKAKVKKMFTLHPKCGRSRKNIHLKILRRQVDLYQGISKGFRQ